MAKKPPRKWAEVHPVKDPEPAYPAHLRGISHQQLGSPKGLKGSTFGPASPGRRLSAEERAAVEKKLRESGAL